jgi:hypothetical protein
MPVPTPRDILLAQKAKARGMQNSLRIILEARRSKVPISLAFAFIEQESGPMGLNVFGRDDSIFRGAGIVTEQMYKKYKRERDRTGKEQGVGPAQLTAKDLQDRADELGGCWIPKHTIRAGMERIGWLLGRFSDQERAIASYNAGVSGWRNGLRYAGEVSAKQGRWHKWLS